jgi:uncharacterized protein YjbI with pentapeptide repeats
MRPADRSGRLVELDARGRRLRAALVAVLRSDPRNLSGADLTAADLSDASLFGADLRGARLRSAKLNGTELILFGLS